MHNLCKRTFLFACLYVLVGCGDIPLLPGPPPFFVIPIFGQCIEKPNEVLFRGNGVIVDKKDSKVFVATCAHVVSTCQNVYVYFGERRILVEHIRYKNIADTALLTTSIESQDVTNIVVPSFTVADKESYRTIGPIFVPSFMPRSFQNIPKTKQSLGYYRVTLFLLDTNSSLIVAPSLVMEELLKRRYFGKAEDEAVLYKRYIILIQEGTNLIIPGQSGSPIITAKDEVAGIACGCSGNVMLAMPIDEALLLRNQALAETKNSK